MRSDGLAYTSPLPAGLGALKTCLSAKPAPQIYPEVDVLTNARQIIRNASGRSAAALLAATGSCSRPQLAILFDPLLRFLSDGAEVPYTYRIAGTERKGFIRLAHQQSDLQSALELAVGDCYELGKLPTPDLVIDAGANIGLFTLAASAYWPRARIIAFEPWLENVAAIRRHVSANGVEDRCELVQAALTEDGGDVEFFARGANQGSLSSDIPFERSIRVPGRRLSQVLTSHMGARVVLKLDIEGAELGVLRDIRPMLDAFPDMAIVLELHERPRTEPLLAEMFEGSNFRLEKFKEGANEGLFRIMREGPAKRLAH